MGKNNNIYKIAYHGLAEGTHNFSYECDSEFFSRLSGGMYERGDCHVDIELHKGANLVTLNIEINGDLECECDRCLDMFMVNIEYSGSLFVKFSQEVGNPTFDSEADAECDILWMNPADSHIDLEQYIYESVVLSLPNRRVHPNDENGNSLCDKDMLARFTPVTESDEDESYSDDMEYDEEDGY
ncbi:MAG: DUF177 domain-containing protein [Rikenellaceae bacterium]